MAILITGASGFVALNIVEHLLTAGRDVVGLDRIALPERARRDFARLPGRFTLIGGSLLSSADLRRAMTIAPVDAVIHCAVITAGTAREKADPETIVSINIQGAVATLMTACRLGAKTFIYPSSGAIYGTAARDVARNVVPSGVFRFLTRRVFDVFRGLDQLIWALVFVRAMGLGPIAGILAIFVSDTGVLAKLYAEAIENADRGQVDGIRSTGAAGLMTLRLGVLPQVLPVMLSQALYQLESNSREATILGLVGAGGIGLRLSERIQINAWDQVAYIIVLILITVAAIDFVSKRIRTRLIVGR